MNTTLKNKNIQGKQELLLISLNNFYQNEYNKKNLSMTIGLEPRFSVRKKRQDLGPGAYNTMGSMVKKSFNVTYGI